MTIEMKTEENKKAAMRMKKRRATVKQMRSNSETMKQREYEKMRKRIQRQKKRKERADTSAFVTPQSSRKAVSRVRCTLPKSPTRRREVVKRLAEEEGLVKKIPKSNSNGHALSQETKEVVEKFYCDDLISRIYADTRKSKKVIKPDGTKERVQKRLLLYNLHDAYRLFKQKNSEVTIGVSKFCDLRPAFVETVSEKDLTVCCCPYHENFAYMIQAIGYRNNVKAFLEEFSCNTDSADCMFSRCGFCSSIDVEAVVDKESYEVFMWKGPKLDKVSSKDALHFHVVEVYVYFRHVYFLGNVLSFRNEDLYTR